MKHHSRKVRLLVTAAILCTPQIAAAHPDLAEFEQTAFVEHPTTVDCTLTDGTAATCYEITVGYKPADLEIGPFCPATLNDAGGIWDWTGENAKLYRIDEAFLRMLDDLGYRFFDDDGAVHIVDNATDRPTVDHACINVSPDEDVTITMLLPVDPVMADQPTRLGTVGKVGVALDGVPIFSDAPSIQATGHMPALDICGGHVDPGGWYHWHAT
ncbi:YHYH protein [Antarctobacter heliothermus]|uniref:YHYH protein n=1 Tax=Antarctobacter heliothermus TaxID=74033 RepID=A0A239FRU9_9RHOB|nr:YHYH protein [Antarctobacter heliothermus]SNS59529.1 YHYH protein [Antarctobacter heliothermus]